MFSFFKKFIAAKETKQADAIPKIEYTAGTKFAQNETCDMYMDFEELGGFPFLKTVILGDFSTKIKRVGCSVTFVFKDYELKLHSDNTDIESNQFKDIPVYMTEIDFELNDSEVFELKNKKVKKVIYHFKNKKLEFLPIEF